jgi:uncharacterized membrane protein
MPQTTPTLLTARSWATKYSPESGDLVTGFYVPALECAVRYDRSTGYFSAYKQLLLSDIGRTDFLTPPKRVARRRKVAASG